MNTTRVIGDADLERRFGGLRRLYGDAAYSRLRCLRIAVVGLGGVGSWAVEALARSGVASLTLIDMDHVAESNVNRQIQATSDTLGMAKGDALALRIALIHPACVVRRVDAFVAPDNWPQLLGDEPIDVVIDACDQVRAKLAMATWALQGSHRLICVGAAGGKREPARMEIDDLAKVTHDPLLASLRQRLRRELGLKSGGNVGLRCVYSREEVVMPTRDEGAAPVDASLNCHGYGSSVMVTAGFGMAAAAEALRLVLAAAPMQTP